MEIENAFETAHFTPIGVTFETIDRLVKDKQMDAVALYMAFCAIAEWQKTNSIKATKSFMLKRTGWGKARYEAAKATLVQYNLVENITRSGEGGRVVGWYVKINHMVSSTLHQNQEGGFARGWKNGIQVLSTNSKVLSTKESTCEADASRDGGQKEEPKLFILSEEIKKLKEDSRKHLRVIGRYLAYMDEYYGLEISTAGHLSLAIRRHSKPAKLIADSVTPHAFQDAMERAFKKCERETTLETVIKYLTK